MDDMPKRNRADSSSASSAPSSPPMPALDPHLEDTLTRLGLDNDFKDSVRALSPTTQREVVNDLIRQHNHEQVATAIYSDGHLPDSTHAAIDDVSEGTPRGWEWLNAGEGGDDDDEDDDDDDDGEFMARNPVSALMRMLMEGHSSMPSNGLPRHPLMQAVFLRQQLQQVLGNLEQLSAMRAMGMDRDIDDMSYEELLELEERLGSVSKGIRSDAEVERCFQRLDAAPSAAEGNCPVCLDALNPAAASAETTPQKAGGGGGGDGKAPSSRSSSVVEVLPCIKLVNCGHMFHEPCIRTWLKSDKTCPVCKQEVIPPGARAAR